VLGQQVSLAAACTFTGRLVEAYGAPGPGGLTGFPAPERLATAELEELRSAVGITGSRARTVKKDRRND
jgi:DNA-3-methyladenine glycosylase II/AraC family transcriptional regulator of adaptative response / DNA-3-methyladenine glycosylase II